MSNSTPQLSSNTTNKTKALGPQSTEVIIHPLVLLSVADHYNRVAKDTRNKRVVGVLLGSRQGHTVDVCNSFAVPFEEDVNNPKVWYLDHNFLDSMYWMFKKVTSREEIVGFYSTGPKIKENDIKISDLLKQFCAENHRPIFAIIDVRPDMVGIPTKTYEPVEEILGEGRELMQVFKNVTCRIEAEEAEAVGVEHLLRDINDPSTSQLTFQIKQKIQGLSGMLERLTEMSIYLNKVIKGVIPVNHQIIGNIQTIINLLPNLNVDELVKSMLINTNDIYLSIYISTMIRCIIALHDLLRNKLKYKNIEDDILMTADAAGKDKEGKEIQSQGKEATTTTPGKETTGGKSDKDKK